MTPYHTRTDTRILGVTIIFKLDVTSEFIIKAIISIKTLHVCRNTSAYTTELIFVQRHEMSKCLTFLSSVHTKDSIAALAMVNIALTNIAILHMVNRGPYCHSLRIFVIQQCQGQMNNCQVPWE